MRAGWRQVLGHTIRRGIDEGLFAPDSDVQMVVRVASALIDGLAIRVRLDEAGTDREQAKQLLVDTLHSLLRPRAAAAS